MPYNDMCLFANVLDIVQMLFPPFLICLSNFSQPAQIFVAFLATMHRVHLFVSSLKLHRNSFLLFHILTQYSLK